MIVVASLNGNGKATLIKWNQDDLKQCGSSIPMRSPAPACELLDGLKCRRSMQQSRLGHGRWHGIYRQSLYKKQNAKSLVKNIMSATPIKTIFADTAALSRYKRTILREQWEGYRPA
jgi:hypothetical protein